MAAIVLQRPLLEWYGTDHVRSESSYWVKSVLMSAFPVAQMGGPHFAAQLAAAARGVGMPSSALAGSTSSAGKALAYSKLVRKASRGVFKRVIRKMLQTPDGSLPLCTSNRCIIPSPGGCPR